MEVGDRRQPWLNVNGDDSWIFYAASRGLQKQIRRKKISFTNSIRRFHLYSIWRKSLTALDFKGFSTQAAFRLTTGMENRSCIFWIHSVEVTRSFPPERSTGKSRWEGIDCFKTWLPKAKRGFCRMSRSNRIYSVSRVWIGNWWMGWCNDDAGPDLYVSNSLPKKDLPLFEPKKTEHFKDRLDSLISNTSRIAWGNGPWGFWMEMDYRDFHYGHAAGRSWDLDEICGWGQAECIKYKKQFGYNDQYVP